KSWLDNYIKYTSFTLLLISTIPIVNIFIAFFLRTVTKFERNKTLTEDMMSNLWKIFLLQFINTSLVLVLVNMRITAVWNWNRDFPIFTGSLEDLEPEWYNAVGITLIFTMF